MKDLSNLDKLSPNEELELILEELDNWVFSQESWNDSDFYKIWEITYSYKDVGEKWDSILNLSLFSKLWWLDVDEFEKSDLNKRKEMIDLASNTLLEDISDKRWKIELSLHDIEWIESNDEVLLAKKEIIIWWLKEVLHHLDLVETGLDFEIEKALVWLHFNATSEHKEYIIPESRRKTLLEKVDAINSKIYWEKLSKNSDYVKGIIDYLYTKKNKYDSDSKWEDFDSERLMSDEESQRYSLYIQKIHWLDPWYTPKEKTLPEKVGDQSFSKVDLTTEEIVNFFNNQYWAHDSQTDGMKQKAILNSEVWNFTDTPDWLHIPHEPKVKDVHKILRMAAHENEQHGVSIERHKKLIWNIRWKWNLELAEWTAVLLEDLYDFWQNLFKKETKNWETKHVIDIEKLDYVPSFAKTLAEEVLSDEEFYDFLYLQNKVEPDAAKPHARYLRHKRTWLQRKDVTYTVWKLKAAQYFNDITTWQSVQWDFSDLFEWKVGFDQIETYKKISSAQEESNRVINEQIAQVQGKVENILWWDTKESSNLSKLIIEKELLIKKKNPLPEVLLFHEAVYYWVKQREKQKQISGENKNLQGPSLKELFDSQWASISAIGFNKYLQEKYPWIDFSEDKIKAIKTWFKEKLMNAIEIVEWAVERSKKSS